MLDVQMNPYCHLRIQMIPVYKEGSSSTLTLDWFGLVSSFNGISTFVGYLMPKPFS